MSSDIEPNGSDEEEYKIFHIRNKRLRFLSKQLPIPIRPKNNIRESEISNDTKDNDPTKEDPNDYARLTSLSSDLKSYVFTYRGMSFPDPTSLHAAMSSINSTNYETVNGWDYCQALLKPSDNETSRWVFLSLIIPLWYRNTRCELDTSEVSDSD